MTLEFCQYFVTEGRQNERQPEPVHIARHLALSDKLGYIAKYEGRTKNRELEQMIKIQFCFGCTNSRRRIAPQRGFVIS